MTLSKHPAASKRWIPAAGAVLAAGFLAGLPPSQLLSLEPEERTQFADLQNQLQNRQRINARAGQTHRPAALVPDSDRDPAEMVIRRASALLADLEPSLDQQSRLAIATQLAQLKARAEDTGLLDKVARYRLYQEACALRRKLAFENPLLDFDRLLFVKRVPGSYSHMSDQNYGWWSRPGGGLYILEGFKTDAPQLTCLTSHMPPGSFLRPDLSYDGKKILFAFCRFYPHVAGEPNKVDKTRLPEDAFYHLFEMNTDGSGLRQLTRGRYDDFDARYLPNGEIVFLSTRRGQFLQCGKASAMATWQQDALPDSYVRCGGNSARPVAVYTLHVLSPDRREVRAISAFENFEWTPSVAADGRILYARWDYVDRNNRAFISLWSTHPDGANPQLVYGNMTRSPQAVFEARAIPNSKKIIFTASAHHCVTGGSLVLLDGDRGNEGPAPLTRLTPEVCFPDSEGWPGSWYANPYPLSENYGLASWSHLPLRKEGDENHPKALGLYLYDAFGNRELIHRDALCSSMDPIPLRPRAKPAVITSTVDWDAPPEGCFLLLDVRQGLAGIKRGEVKSLRVVAVPPKTQPRQNHPRLGMTGDDPGKCVLGTVPVEPDGSAYFRAPSGWNVFFQALDAEGFAIQTMRTVTYVQPGQMITCIGCHESRQAAPPNLQALASRREPSKITLGPEGSWPLRFDRLVQPVLDQHCVSCHRPGSVDAAAAKINLTTSAACDTLVAYGQPSLKDHVKQRYYEGRSWAGQGAARTSALLAYLRAEPRHQAIQLGGDSLNRLITWMDTCAQQQGSFSAEQEQHLREARSTLSSLLQEQAMP